MKVFSRTSLFLVLLIFGGAGAWADDYLWTGASSNNWSDIGNWYDESIPGAATTAPGNLATDRVLIQSSATINLTGNVTIQWFAIDTPTGNVVTLNLNGNTLNIGSSGYQPLELGTSSTISWGTGGTSTHASSATRACTFVVNGTGTINCAALDTNNNTNNQVTLDSTVLLKVSGTAYFDQSTGTSTAFTGDGTSTVQFTGTAYQNPSVSFSGVNVKSGTNTYTLSTSGTFGSGQTVTVTVTDSGGGATQFQYEAQVSGTKTYTVASSVSISSNVTAATNFPSTASGGTYVFTIVYPAMAAGDALTLSVLVGNIPVGSVSYTQPANNPVWVGGNGTGAQQTDWSNAANWSTGVAPTSSSAVEIAATAFVPVLTANSAASSVVVDTGASLNLAGFNLAVSSTITNNGTVLLAGGSSQSLTGTRVNNAGSLVTYNSGGTSYPVWGSSYVSLTVATGTTLTLDRNISVSGTLNVQTATSVLVANGKNLTVTTTLTNVGTLRFLGTETATVPAGTIGGTVAYVGTNTGQTLCGLTNFTNVTFSGAGGVWTPAAGITVATALTITAGTLSLGSTNLDVSAGTLTINGGTLKVTGTPATFAAGTLSFTSGTFNSTATNTLTVSGNATLKGTFTDASNFNTLNLTGAGALLDSTATLANLTVAGTPKLSTDPLTLGGSLLVNSGSLDMNGLALTMNGTKLAGTVTNTGTAANFTAQTGALVLQAATSITTGNGNATFSSTVDGGFGLSVTAGTGAVSFAGSVGATSALNSLTVVSSATTSLHAVKTVLNQSYTASGASGVTLNGALEAANTGVATITVTGQTTLGANSTIAVDNNNAGSGVSLGAVDGLFSLAVTTNQGRIGLGIVGAANPPTTLTLSTTTANATYPITLAGNISTSGNVSMTGAVVLSADLAIVSTAPATGISFANTVDSVTAAHALSVSVPATKTISFTGNVGSTLALSTLTVTQSGGTTLSGTLSAATLNVADTTGLVKVVGNTTLTTGLVTASKPYQLEFDGATNAFAGTTTLLNTNTVKFSGATSLTAGLVVNGSAATVVSKGTSSVALSTTSGGVTLTAGGLTLVTGDTVSTQTLTINGGTLTSALTGTNLSVGALTMSSGTIDNTSVNVITASGNVALTGGTYGATTTNGTIVMTGTSTPTLNAGVSLGNLTVNPGSGNTVQLTGSALTLNGNLLVTSGSLDMNGLGVTMSGSQLGGSVVNTNAGTSPTFHATAALTLASATSITTFTTSNGGAIQFDSTIIDSVANTDSLTLAAGSGAVTLGGAVGATALKSLSVTSTGTISVKSVTTGGGGAQSYTGPVVLTANSTWTSGGAGITVTGTIDADLAGNNRTLALNSGAAGAVSVTGAIGASAGLAGLTVTNSGGTTFAGNVVVNQGGATVTLTNTTGTIDVQGNLTTGTLATANAPYNVKLESPGTSTITTATSFLNTGTLTLGSVLASVTTFTGGLATNGATHPTRTYVTGTVNTTDQAMTLLAVTVQTAAATLNTKSATGGALSVSTVDGAQNLTMTAGTGLITVTGAVGAATALGSGTGAALTIASASSAAFSSTVKTANGVSITPPVTFSNTVDLDGSNTATVASATTLSGAVSFNQGAAQTFQSSHDVTFSSTVGWTNALSIKGLTANNPSVTFNGALNSTSNSALTVDTSGGGTGTVTFNATVGATNAVGVSQITAKNLTFAASTSFRSNNANITFQTDNLVLNAAPAATINAGTATFQILPLTAGESIEFAPVASLYPGTANVFINSGFAGVTAGSFIVGGTSQTGAIYLGNAGNSVTVPYVLSVVQSQTGSGGITFYNSFSTSSNQNLVLTSGTSGITLGNASPVTINLGSGTLTLTAGATAGDGTVTLAQNATITATGGVLFPSTVRGGFTLSVDTGASALTFNGIVGGGGFALASLLSTSTTGSTVFNASGVTTTGNQTYSNPVSLGTSVTFTANAGSLIRFSSTLSATGAFSATVTTADARFDGAVGGGGNLTALSVDGTTAINTSAISTTTGGQTYTGAVTLGVSPTLTGNSGTLVHFLSTVAGTAANTLHIATANARFDGAVGAGNQISTLTVDGATALNTAVTTTGGQTYTGAVTLGANSTLTGNSGALVWFKSTVDGGFTLTVATANARFDGAVGGGTALASLSVAGTTAINTAGMTTSGTQTYTGAVTLGASTMLAASTATFVSTVSGAFELNTSGSTAVVFEDDVSIGTSAGTSTYAGNVSFAKAGSAQTYTSPGTVTFDKAIDLTTTTQPVNLTITKQINANTATSNLKLGSGGTTITGPLNMTSGTLTGYAGVQDLTFVGVLPATTVTFGTVSFPAYAANQNRIVFSGSNAITWNPNGQVLNDVVFGATGGVTIAGNVAVRGNLTENTGCAVSFGSQIIAVQGNVTLTVNLTAGTSTLSMDPASGTVGLSAAASLANVVINGAGTVQQLSDLTTTGNFIVYRGAWVNNDGTNYRNLTVGQDFIAFGSGYADYTLNWDYSTLTATSKNYKAYYDGEVAVTRGAVAWLAYPYWGTYASTYSAFVAVLGAAYTMWDGTNVQTGTATGSLTIDNGKSVNVTRNFYNYGASMAGNNPWSLNLPTKYTTKTLNSPTKSTDWFGEPFAVAISTNSTMSIKNCHASELVAAAQTSVGGSGSPNWTSAVDLTPGGNNNWDNTQPDISTTTPPATRFDNLVEITFTKPIMNAGNEASAAVGTTTPADYVRFNNGTSSASAIHSFSESAGVMGDGTDEYITSTVPANDTQYAIAFQAATGVTWSTDATGTGAGPTTSTDRAGLANRTAVPDVAIEKGRLYDSSGNPIVNHDGVNFNAGQSTTIASTIDTSTVDKARPVLLKVYIGQAAKNFPATTEEDGHNYWHLVWSEPVHFSGLASMNWTGSPIGSYPGNVSSATGTVGANNKAAISSVGAVTGNGSTVSVAGLIQYSGALYTGSRTTMLGQSVPNRTESWAENNQSTMAVTESLARGSARDLYVYLAGLSDGTTWDGFWWGPAGSPATTPVIVPYTYYGKVLDAAGNSVEDNKVKTWAGSNAVTIDEDSNFDSVNVLPSVNTTSAHQDWEWDAPTFASYTPTSGTYEAIPLDTTVPANDMIDTLQFHILSNAKNSGQTSSWDSTTGHPDKTNAVHFGVRDSTLSSFTSGLTMGTDFTNPSSFIASFSGVNTGVDNPLFDGGGGTFSTVDDGYFQVTITEISAWKPSAQYYIHYDPFLGMTTNLAGRLIEPPTGLPVSTNDYFKALDLSPPIISLALTGKDMRRIYIQFSRTVKLDVSATSAFTLTSPSGNTITGVTFIDGTASGFQQAFLELAAPFKASELFTARIQAGSSVAIEANNNFMDATIQYPVANVGLNFVEPVWASDGSGGEANVAGTDHVIHDFTGQSFLAPRDIEIQSKIFGGSSISSLPLRLFYDTGTPASTTSSGLWLPLGISSAVSPAVVPSQGDTSARHLNSSSSNSAGDLQDFVIPGNDPGLVNDSTVQFLYQLGGVYIVRSTDPTDPRQMAPWSFQLRAIRTQKNGVTILNNVIDPTKGQKTQILYTMKRAGVVTCEVFALDGSAIQVLERGRQAAGDYSLFWDGKNSSGRVVARGIYFIRVVGPDMDEIRNVLVIK